MKKKQNKRIEIMMGYLIFFLTVSLIVTVALIVYESLRDSFEGERGAVTLIMLAVIFCAALFCTLIDIVRREIMVNRPVKRILAATERISTGDFSVRLEISHAYGSYDEYDLIMDNLNILAEELGRNELQKTEFISNVAHELRTPTAAIKNTAELLASRAKGEEERRELFEIAASAGRLGELVGNILKLGKLENNTLQPSYESFQLSRLLEESLVLYTDKIDEKGIELTVELEEFSVMSSPSHIEIIFTNLISNAVKFTDEGGKISVTLRREGNDAIFEISDTGCGISKKDGAKIFDKFYQADTSHATEGTGLGLPLCRRVLDILGGDISVESELGVGTAFTVRLRMCVI